MKTKHVIRRKFKTLCMHVNMFSKIFIQGEMYKHASNCYAPGTKINKTYPTH